MLKALVMYYELAIKAVETGGYTWNKLREVTNDVWFKLTQMKFEDPAQGESKFSSLRPRSALIEILYRDHSIVFGNSSLRNRCQVPSESTIYSLVES